jgi:predicted transposase YdaD
MIEPTIAGLEQSRFYRDIIERGKQEGVAQGISQGISQGILQETFGEKERTVLSLLSAGMSIECIANISGLASQQIESLQKKHSM